MKFKMIALEDINPYDHIHFPTKEEWLSVEGYSQEHLLNDYIYHLEGIEWAKDQILSGIEILPILVTEFENGRYQRRDGYKRYMAFKKLGKKYIPCYIATEEEALQCPQDKKFSIGD